MPRYLTTEQAYELRDLGLQCCHLFVFAAQVAAAQNKMSFLIIPKLHMFHHVCLDLGQDQLNPRAFHNFSGEDYMGYLKKIVQISPQGQNLSYRVLKRSLIKVMSLSNVGSSDFTA